MQHVGKRDETAFNPLKLNCHYIYHLLNWHYSTRFVCVFYMILSVNNDYVLEQR